MMRAHRLRSRPQFQALLRHRPVARTAHFALHHTALPLASGHAQAALFATGSTWIGALVPKRWARRAVRRNLIRRQIHALGMAPAWDGAALVRLRAAFSKADFPSASSAALRRAVRAELRQLLRKTPRCNIS